MNPITNSTVWKAINPATTAVTTAITPSKWSTKKPITVLSVGSMLSISGEIELTSFSNA